MSYITMKRRQLSGRNAIAGMDEMEAEDALLCLHEKDSSVIFKTRKRFSLSLSYYLLAFTFLRVFLHMHFQSALASFRPPTQARSEFNPGQVISISTLTLNPQRSSYVRILNYAVYRDTATLTKI